MPKRDSDVTKDQQDKPRTRRKRGAVGILRELHRYFDFDQPFDPCPHGGGAKPCCCGFADPKAINAVFAEAYALLNPEKPPQARVG